MSQGKDIEIKSEIKKLYEHIAKEVRNGKINIPDDLINRFLQFEKLAEPDQVKLINTLLKKENLPKEICRFIELFKLKKAPLFEVVPEEVLNQMYEFNNLNKEETALSSLALTSKEHYKLFQPGRLFSKFQQQVAFGGQDKIEALFTLLKKQKRDIEIQEVLCKKGKFTDYSGRAFHCTAYEYAYWAKDTHMCRMLERHMDEKTKAVMLKCCEVIEKDGLKYIQNGQSHCTKHFDLTPLKTALREYVHYNDNYTNIFHIDLDAAKAAWLKVGIAQRDVPAHVIHEYCFPNRTFENPNFKENELARVMTFFNTERNDALFPLVITRNSGLGVDFSLLRGRWSGMPMGAKVRFQSEIATVSELAKIDLLAISRLDKVRTEDLKQSLENLKPKDLDKKQKHGCVIS